MPAGRQHSRDRLAGTLWSDRGDEQARGSLRKALSALRSAVGADAFVIDRDSVAVREDALVVDAEEWRCWHPTPTPPRSGPCHSAMASFSTSSRRPARNSRTGCRSNDAMPQSDASGSGKARREACGGGVALEAQSVCQRLLAVDNLREESHRLLMRLYADAGERSQALAQFQACRDLLKRELGVEPSQETVRLSREISMDAQPSGAPEPAPKPESAAAPATSWPTERQRGLSIAVLPFAGHSGEDQDFLANGLSQDIITELSRQKEFLVIAPQSSFAYGNGARTASVAAGELDVRYILSGSMRRAGDRLRVTAQLIDAAGDRCVWLNAMTGGLKTCSRCRTKSSPRSLPLSTRRSALPNASGRRENGRRASTRGSCSTAACGTSTASHDRTSNWPRRIFRGGVHRAGFRIAAGRLGLCAVRQGHLELC